MTSPRKFSYWRWASWACACALELALHGVPATVLERSIPGAEASSAAGGILAPQLECTEPGPLADLAHLSLKLYPKWAHQLQKATGIDVEFRSSGGHEVSSSAAEIRKVAKQKHGNTTRAQGLSTSAPALFDRLNRS